MLGIQVAGCLIMTDERSVWSITEVWLRELLQLLLPAEEKVSRRQLHFGPVSPTLAVPFELRPKLLDPTRRLPGSALFQSVHDSLYGPDPLSRRQILHEDF